MKHIRHNREKCGGGQRWKHLPSMSPSKAAKCTKAQCGGSVKYLRRVKSKKPNNG